MIRRFLYAGILFSSWINAKGQKEPPPYSAGITINSVTVYQATTPEKNFNSFFGKAPLQTKQTTQYLDGLGRTIQIVAKQSSPLSKDIVSATYYDDLGRIQYSFLPFVSAQTPGGNELTNDGAFKLNPFQQQKAFYQAQLTGQNETFYYSQTEFDGSPLNRVTKSFQPGNSWIGSNKYSEVVQDFNTSDENVHIWQVASNTSNPTSNVTQVYPTGKLSKSISYDEDRKQTVTYTDLSGNTILRKVQEKDGTNLSISHSGWACTYYVYDDYNQLRFIIPPKAVVYLDNNGWNLSSDMVSELCFKYEYDATRRIILKKQPGAGEITMVYDSKDRAVFTQDANLNKSINTLISTSKWIFNLYDEQDRVIATGLVDNNLSRQSLQDIVNNLSTSDVVTISAFVGNGTYQTLKANCPVAGFPSNDNLLFNNNVVYNSISHYDSYDYQGVKPFNSNYTLAYTPPSQNTEAIQATDRTLGFATGEKLRIIDNDNNNSNDQFTFSTAYYDNKGRSVQTLSTNAKGGLDYETNQFAFSGKLMSTCVTHDNGSETYTIVSKNEYDKDGRLIHLSKNFNTSFYKSLAEYSYNELGQLKQKRLAPGFTASGKQEIESQDYIYNIQGSLVGINKDYALSSTNSAQWDHYFGLCLGFDNKDNLFAKSELTGTITGTIWKSQGDNSIRKYDYTYDNLGRFTAAQFLQKKRPSDNWSNTEMDFSVYADYEDLNGNLKVLKQMGVVPGGNGVKVIDDLRYHYRDVGTAIGQTGNQLKRIDDNLSTLSINGVLGDFKDGSNATGTDDYNYDTNGNLTSDANKNVATGGIIYNFQNKPVKITLQNKSIVEYTYDASGRKLTKKVTNSLTGGVIYTHYMGDFVYEEVNSQLALKYILHEEGRVKIITPVNDIRTNTSVILNNGSSGFGLSPGRQGVFEYFIKDHLGNTRMVLTEEVQQETYRAYMETANASVEEALFGNLPPAPNELARARTDNSQVTVPWPGNNTGFVKQSASSGKVVGPNIFLKVMAGDVINATSRYFYYLNNSASGTTTPLNEAVSSLIAALSGSSGSGIGKAYSGDVASNLLSSGGDFAYFINNTQPSTGIPDRPKAYLNIVFLDEQFKFIPSEGIGGIGSTAQRVSVANNGNVNFDIMMQKAPKNGWVYVYLSNESIEPVYFDDFFVTLNHERISEENHYYPHGLKIEGLRSCAFNKLENRYGYQGAFNEEESETGYNEFFLRTYDPQIGRWNAVDPYDQFASPYIGMGNDPVNLVDPSGGINIYFGAIGQITGSVLADRAFITLGGAAIGFGIDKATGGNGWKGAAIGGGFALGATFIPPFDISVITSWTKDWLPGLLAAPVSGTIGALGNLVGSAGAAVREDRDALRKNIDGIGKSLLEIVGLKEAFTEKWKPGATGGKLPESLAEELIDVQRIVWSDYIDRPDKNGMHAWHAGSNATLTNKLGPFGAMFVFLGGIYHETPLDKASFKAEQDAQGTINHILDSFSDIGANIFGMGIGLILPKKLAVKAAIKAGNQIPGPGDPDPNGLGTGGYRGNPLDAWGQYPKF